MHTFREASHTDPTKLAAARHAQGWCGARGGHTSTFTVTGNSGGGVQGRVTRGRLQGKEAPKERLRVDKAMHVIPKSQEHWASRDGTSVMWIKEGGKRSAVRTPRMKP